MHQRAYQRAFTLFTLSSDCGAIRRGKGGMRAVSDTQDFSTHLKWQYGSAPALDFFFKERKLKAVARLEWKKNGMGGEKWRCSEFWLAKMRWDEWRVA